MGGRVIEAAFGWIGELAHYLASWLPRLLVVQSSHCAVKYVRGARAVALGPGLHVYWPLVTPIETCAVVRQVLDVPARLMETAEGETVVASAVIEYEIADAILFLAETEDGYRSIQKLTGAVVRQVVMENKRGEIRDDDELVRRLLAGAAQEALEPYGVHVLSARLEDFALVRALHVTGDSHARLAQTFSDESS